MARQQDREGQKHHGDECGVDEHQGLPEVGESKPNTIRHVPDRTPDLTVRRQPSWRGVLQAVVDLRVLPAAIAGRARKMALVYTSPAGGLKAADAAHGCGRGGRAAPALPGEDAAYFLSVVLSGVIQHCGGVGARGETAHLAERTRERARLCEQRTVAQAHVQDRHAVGGSLRATHVYHRIMRLH